ncbi:MAG: HAD family hydrolase, partial [Lentisphaeria bacterium]|nr:HAD family hydrolase [Lentisphaeria bacterium]
MIGFDFDNTLVCYGELFYSAALSEGYISADFSRSKNAIRDFMNGSGMRDEWTALQGKVYGTMMDQAQLFPGAAECLQDLKSRDIPCCIISHKTRFAKKGPPFDLHEAAREFLRKSSLPIPPEMIFFCPEREEKIRLIRSLKCDYFVDDLPEV